MKYLFSLIFLILALNLSAQKSKKTQLYQGTAIVATGFLKGNQKDSLWTYYGLNNRPSAVGYYKDGQRYGIWVFFDFDGSVSERYDASANKLLYHKPKPANDTIKYAIITGTDTIYALLDHPPMYCRGLSNVSVLLMHNIRYPSHAKENNTMGKTIVGITVDEYGHVTNYRIKKFIKDGISEEALRVAKLIDDDWIPAYYNNKPVKVEYTLPMNFTLGNQ